MSYTALARKWRPRSFDELVGQENVVVALQHALKQNRVHHAYLLTGTRGVGKTTIGRILARALNCQTGVTADPCGMCDHCKAIDEGRFIDLIEVDAASRTGVDDTRELLENTQYSPSIGRYKVYLIDEVHMLSNSSFNALLKTLEEPPEHVKFILATTDPDKLPVTVLSRCIQLNLRALEEEQIATQLNKILKSEHIEFEANAIHAIAKAADGSMRDGLSLLDQAIAVGSGSVSVDGVFGMLGWSRQNAINEMFAALVRGDAGAIHHWIYQARQGTFSAGHVLDQIMHECYQAHLVAMGVLPTDAGISRLILDQWSQDEVQLAYQITLNAKRDLHFAPNTWMGLEMILLRIIAFRSAGEDRGVTDAGVTIAEPTQPDDATAAGATTAPKQ